MSALLREMYAYATMPPDDVRLHMVAWLERHGISPTDVCIPGWIERDEERYRVRYQAYARNERGDRYVNADRTDAVREVRMVQLEGPPLPFPVW